MLDYEFGSEQFRETLAFGKLDVRIIVRIYHDESLRFFLYLLPIEIALDKIPYLAYAKIFSRTRNQNNASDPLALAERLEQSQYRRATKAMADQNPIVGWLELRYEFPGFREPFL